MNPQINVILFSKDRPAQAHACLKSMFKHFKEAQDAEKVRVTVLYKTTNDDFEKGYELAKSKLFGHKNLSWQNETNFRLQTIQLVETSTAERVMFLVDDIIFVAPFSLKDPEIEISNHPMMVATSLRLHSGITHCYATDTPSSVPKFVKNFVWDWRNGEGDWGYPMSVDGNIYQSDYIKRRVSHLSFTNPNTFEAALDSVKLGPTTPVHLSCYLDGPKLINIPANRVQNQFNNRFAWGSSAEDLNEQFLAGKEIDIDSYDGLKENTCHVPVELYLK